MTFAIINQVGISGRGTTTLCLEYAKLGIDVFIKCTPDSVMILDKHIQLYTTSEQLLAYCAKYKRVLFLNMWRGTMPHNVLDDAILLRQQYPSLQICHINCSRKIKELTELMECCVANNFMFDSVFSIDSIIDDFGYCPYTSMNVNAFTVPEIPVVSQSNRKPIVFSSGSMQKLKGVVAYLNSVDDIFLSNCGHYMFIHEGAEFSFNKNCFGIHCSPQMLSLFEKVDNVKVPKKFFDFKNYGEEPSRGKISIYPVYDVNSIHSRWSYYYAGICCILGTVSGYCTVKSLIGNSVQVCDLNERRRLIICERQWNSVMEYADMEKIICGIPTFFSKRYAELLGFNCEELIYDKFSDIPEKVTMLDSCYDRCREEQIKWFINKQENVNRQIVSMFGGL